MNEAVQAQSEIIRRNISAVAEMQRRDRDGLPPKERIADRITAFSGSMVFVYIHVLWFGLWILLNVGLISFPPFNRFDPYPFGLLTLVVSLEAIFLSTFLLIAQNRMAKEGERRAELDLQINLLAEQKTAKILEMLDEITQQLDQAISRFSRTPDAEVEALKVSPHAGDVLQVIEEAIKDETADREDVSRSVATHRDATGAVRPDASRIREKVEDVIGDGEPLDDLIVDPTTDAAGSNTHRQ